MKNEDLQKITTNIQNKLGDNAALILDDLGTILTDNSQMNDLISQKDKEIEVQKNTNKQLQSTNIALFQQVSVGKENDGNNLPQENEKPTEKFSLKSCFDDKGRFKK